MSATHCDQHQQAFVWKPAGISKRTGQPYNAFQACPVMNCRERPAKANGGFLAAPQTHTEPRTGPSAPAPLPGASGVAKDRQIIAQVAYKCAVESLGSGGQVAGFDVISGLAELIYLDIWRLSHIDPDEASQ